MPTSSAASSSTADTASSVVLGDSVAPGERRRRQQRILQQPSAWEGGEGAMVSVAIVSIATASTAHVVAQLERVVPVRAEAASLGRAAKLRGHKVCLVCEDLVCLERRLRIPRE